MTCESKNIVYLIQCEKCKNRYIGESERSLKERISEHKGYIKNNHQDKATGAHFNQKGHTLEHMKERERFFIQKFNTYHQGMNRKP